MIGYYLEYEQTKYDKELNIQLLEQLQGTEGDTRKDILGRLILNNMRFVHHQVSKIMGHPECTQRYKTSRDEFVQLGVIALMKAINTFKIHLDIQFATYASRCITNELLMFIRKHKKQINDHSLDEVVHDDHNSINGIVTLSELLADPTDDIGSSIESEWFACIRRTLYNSLTPRELRIIRGTFFEEKTQKELADEMGFSQSYISRLQKRAIEKAKKMYLKELRLSEQR